MEMEVKDQHRDQFLILRSSGITGMLSLVVNRRLRIPQIRRNKMSKLKSLTFDEYKVAAKVTLNEAIDEEPDAVIVLMFHRGSGQFKIKCSKIENRLELVGALEEAKNHVLVTGYAS
jgi:hypothetical protein